MIAYSMLMFAIALIISCLATAIYRGNTNLIHSYHQTYVKEADKKQYGKSFSKGLFVLAVALILSGFAALLGTTGPIVMLSIGVMLARIIAAFIIIAKVQKEFNGGF